jgi:hypothetical protein
MRQRHEMPERTWYWCTAHYTGHPLGGERCPEWLAAVAAGRQVINQRRAGFERKQKRSKPVRQCLICGVTFRAPGAGQKGRPQEICGRSDCLKTRRALTARARRSGKPVSLPKPGSNSTPRPVYRHNEQLEALIQAFDRGWHVASH